MEFKQTLEGQLAPSSRSSIKELEALDHWNNFEEPQSD
ncbi:hypothetical protein CCACVL1_27468 [Corchorus capsularis]|uniref:Uncharacterized protein n=1 Tax=Corchorus capsularis TaxID=210143 RepID=A0A1R3G9Z8_COCAP|nr:hypothetical protein CCACVL1_27468 [Corchorus capsularis]